MDENLLELKNLTRRFKIGGMILGKSMIAVDKVNISLPKDKTWIMSIVGESGSGKTTLAKMILCLLEPSSGEITLDGIPLSYYKKRGHKREFYKNVQPIFQNPFSTFSMRKTVDTYLFETVRNLEIAKKKDEVRNVIEESLNAVGLEIDQVLGKYPNQFSGGELQRIAIARALITKPRLIVADEPVAMIDASLRMNVVNLFRKLKDEYKVNFIYITHDLSTAYYVSDYIATLYHGSLIEFGNAKEILNNPAHPYTELLLDSIPKVGDKWDQDKTLQGSRIKDYALDGCKFAPRCPYVKDICKSTKPCMVQINNDHKVLCYKQINYNRLTDEKIVNG